MTPEDSFEDSSTSSFESDRERLRAVLDFPEAIESSERFEPHAKRTHEAASDPATVAPVEESIDVPAAAGDAAGVARRLDQLGSRVDALAALVESLFDRVERSVSRHSPLTVEELADISARMVRLIEERLATHSERLEQMVTSLSERAARVSDGGDGSVDTSAIDDHLAMMGRALLDMKKSMQELERTPEEVQELAILSHFDQWFEETNSRQASDVEHMRRDLHRFDTALIEMQARIAELPDREALRGLSQSLAEITSDSDIAALRSAIDGLPRQLALEQPTARLDASIIEQLNAKLSETTELLSEKVEQQLAARVQRFEALSQAMMTLVGDPVDSLSAKLADVVRRLDQLAPPST